MAELGSEGKDSRGPYLRGRHIVIVVVCISSPAGLPVSSRLKTDLFLYFLSLFFPAVCCPILLGSRLQVNPAMVSVKPNMQMGEVIRNSSHGSKAVLMLILREMRRLAMPSFAYITRHA